MQRFLPVSVLLLLSACAHRPAVTRDAECRAEFEALRGLLSRNYAGWEDKHKRWPSELAKATESARAQADQGPQGDACTAVLETWVDAFRDNHLGIRPRSQTRKEHDSGQHAQGDEAPRVSARAEDGLVLKLPSFAPEWKAKIDALIGQEQKLLETAPLLVVDLRGNSGGGDSSFAALEPYLFSGPFSHEGVDVRASDENVMAWKFIARVGLPADHPAHARIRALTERMELELSKRKDVAPPASGFWMPFLEPGVNTVGPVSANPKHVLLVVDRGCASACEQLAWDFKKGKRGRVVGTRTRGALDYANVVALGLPSGRRHIQFPTTRSRREFRVDDDGIPPDEAVDEKLLGQLSGEQLLQRLRSDAGLQGSDAR